MKTIECWACSDCGYNSSNKSDVEHHERKCSMNKANKACSTCRWLSTERDQPQSHYNHGSYGCDKLFGWMDRIRTHCSLWEGK